MVSGERRQSYQKLRAACRQRALSFLICCAGMTLTWLGLGLGLGARVRLGVRVRVAARVRVSGQGQGQVQGEGGGWIEQLTGGSLKKVGDSCCTQLLILTKSSRRLPAHLVRVRVRVSGRV